MKREKERNPERSASLLQKVPGAIEWNDAYSGTNFVKSMHS